MARLVRVASDRYYLGCQRRPESSTIIEQFSHDFDRFFDEPNYLVRWERLKAISSQDQASFRVLFLIETLGLLEKWQEPVPHDLNRLLEQKLGGGRIAVRIGLVMDLFQPVWPLEIAKYEYLVHRATCDSEFRRKYLMTGIRSYSTALVQTRRLLALLRAGRPRSEARRSHHDS